MSLIKFYCYLDYQTFDFFRRVLKYDTDTAKMAAGYSIGLSLTSLLYSLDLIIRRIFDVAGIFTSNYRILILVIVVALFSFTVFNSCDYERFEANNPSEVKQQSIRTFFFSSICLWSCFFNASLNVFELWLMYFLKKFGNF